MCASVSVFTSGGKKARGERCSSVYVYAIRGCVGGWVCGWLGVWVAGCVGGWVYTQNVN
jgi:hypothetical protein